VRECVSVCERECVSVCERDRMCKCVREYPGCILRLLGPALDQRAQEMEVERARERER
jgi:hypothetical protein